MLCETPILRYFDPKEANIVLQCDASQSGLGVCLMQSGQPIGYVACALTQAEENYAQIENSSLCHGEIGHIFRCWSTYCSGVKL